MRRLIFVLTFILAGSFSIHALAVTDDTTCTVKSENDNSDFHTLRRKVVEGFNRPRQRACVELINFDNSLVSTIILNSPLSIEHAEDDDCTADHPLCNDNWAFILDGGGARVNIDVTGIDPGECALTVHTNKVLFKKINIEATEAQIQSGHYLCNEGTGNNFDDVTVNGESGEPQDNQVPVAPSNLEGTVAGDAPNYRVNLTWDDDSDNEDGFRIERAVSSGDSRSCGSFSELANADADAITHEDSTVEAGTRYCYRVFSFNQEGDSVSPSNVVVIGIPDTATAPEAPSDLEAGVEGDADNFQINLMWNDNSDDEDGFRVERATVAEGEVDCGPFESLGTLPINTTEATDGSAQVNTTYCYRVFSFKGSTDSASPSNVVQVNAPEILLPLPTELTATALSDTEIDLTWTYEDMVEISGFRVERGDETCAEASFSQIGQVTADLLEYHDNGLDPETTYCYRVQAYRITPAVDSDYSDSVTGTTLEEGMTPTPTPDPDDPDGDVWNNDQDNCPNDYNPGQENQDGDAQGDACDEDIDGDGVPNDQEVNQGTDPNDPDFDDDGHLDGNDNCPIDSNPGQEDADGDGVGDPCDSEDPDDIDGDGLDNNQDNCPNIPNPDQADGDGDNIGDACDTSGDVQLGTGGCTLQPAAGGESLLWLLAAALGGFIYPSLRRKSESN